MTDKFLVSRAVEKKLSNQLLFAVVNECFMNGLPIDKSSMSAEEEKQLQQYTWHVMEAFGGIDSLDRAVDFNNKTPGQNLFLGKIYDVCTEAAKSVSKECTKDCGNKNFKEVVATSSLTPKDYAKFNAKKDSLNLDKVAEIIKDKTLKVLKDEQEQYDKEQELDQELKDALNDAKEKKDPNAELGIGMEDTDADDPKAPKLNTEKVKESMVDINLGKIKPRNHVTVFSRFQDTAMEMAHTIATKSEDNYMPYVYKITFESFLKEFDLPEFNKAMESVGDIVNEEICDGAPASTANAGKMSTLVSIIVYTMMETLKTLGIFNPTQAVVRKYVNHAATVQEMMNTSEAELYKNAYDVIKRPHLKDYSKMSNPELATERMIIQNAMEAAQKYFPEGNQSTELADIVSEGLSQVSSIDGIVHQREYDMRNAQPAQESMVSQRQKAHDIAQFNKIHYMFSSNPLISNIKLVVSPSHPSVIKVECANESGNVVRNSCIQIEYPCAMENYVDYISSTFIHSKFSDTSKEVSVKMNDGYGQIYSLNRI